MVIELVFDAIEFKQGASANIDKINLGNPEITSNWDDIDLNIANRLRKYTNVYFDYETNKWK